MGLVVTWGTLDVEISDGGPNPSHAIHDVIKSHTAHCCVLAPLFLNRVVGTRRGPLRGRLCHSGTCPDYIVDPLQRVTQGPEVQRDRGRRGVNKGLLWF